MKKTTLVIFISLTILSCGGKKGQQYIDLDNSKIEYTLQEDFYLPILSKSKMRYKETKRFRKYSDDFKKYSLKGNFYDTTTTICYKKDEKIKCKSYSFFNGYLSTVIETDSVKAPWNDNNNNQVYFKWETQTSYYENKKILSYLIFLKGNNLSSDFLIGTRFFFDKSGRMSDSFDFSTHYQTSLEKIYKKLYEIEKPFNYENIRRISRYYDAINSAWIITYTNPHSYILSDSYILIDDKTLEIHILNHQTKEKFKQTIKSIYKDFDFNYIRYNDHYFFK